MRHRTLTAALAAMSLLAGLFALVPGAGAQELPKPAGEASLLNFEHIFNSQTTGTPADGHATDLEFFTNDVPLRDENGDKVLDENGDEILVTRDFAVMGSYQGGAWIYDITDPEGASQVVNIPCGQTQNDIQIKRFGGRVVVALAKDGSGNPCGPGPHKGAAGQAGISLWDITDPYDYSAIYTFRTSGGAHNFTFHPTKPYGYVSTGDLPGALNHMPVIDFSDFDNPKLAADPQIVGGPHDIAFSTDGNRAYVASENNLQIWNTTNPAAPVQVSVTPNNGTYAHGFDPTPDGRYAVGTNESLALGGFFVGGTAVCPGEGLTIYDIADESRPVPVGQFMAPVVGNPNSARACTGHVGEIAPNGRVMMMGWYAGGARVIDFSNPSAPREVGHAVMSNSEVWTANFYKGPYMYTADQRRGFDIFKWTGGPVAPWQSDFTPAPTAITDVSTTDDGGSISIEGAATFGGEAPVVMGEDFPGDSPGGPQTAELGADLLAGSIYQPDPDDPMLVFEWDVTNLPPSGVPEGVRYTFPFDINNKSFQPQAKFSNVASITMVDEQPGHVENIGKSFQLRGNCTAAYPAPPSNLSNCPHVAWLTGQFDPANDAVRLFMPIGASFAPEVQPGAVFRREEVAGTTIVAAVQAVVSNATTSDEADWLAEDTYTVPDEAVSFGIAPEGTPIQLVSFGAGTVDADGGLSGSVDTSGLAAGAYDLYVRACFGANCDTVKLGVTV